MYQSYIIFRNNISQYPSQFAQLWMVLMDMIY